MAEGESPQIPSYGLGTIRRPFVLRLMTWQTVGFVLTSLWLLGDLDSAAAPVAALAAPFVISVVVWRLGRYHQVQPLVQRRRRTVLGFLWITVIWTLVHAYMVWIARPAMIYARDVSSAAKRSAPQPTGGY